MLATPPLQAKLLNVHACISYQLIQYQNICGVTEEILKFLSQTRKRAKRRFFKKKDNEQSRAILHVQEVLSVFRDTNQHKK